MAEQNEQPDSASSPFDAIVDDTAERAAASEWARQQLLADRDGDEVIADLVSQGWSDDDAAMIVETERKRTRAQRGVLTRDAVATGVDQAYRSGQGGWSIGFPTIAAARRLLHAIASLRWLKKLSKRPRS
jgi:hypothetical protein